jgi:hypothetical protein
MNSFQAGAKSTLLNFVVTKASADLDLDVFNDLGPNGCGEPRRFQHPPEQVRREPRFLVVPSHDIPGRAAGQAEHIGLLVKSLKSCCDKRVACSGSIAPPPAL